MSHTEIVLNHSVHEPSAQAEVDHDSISRLAYDYWLTRGRPEGAPEEDWLRAEHDLHRLGLALHVQNE